MDCISNWEELFCILQREAEEKGTSVVSMFSHIVLLIHVHKYTSTSSAVYNSSSYCQLSDSIAECEIVAVYSQSIFDTYPGALLLSLSGGNEVSVHFQRWLRMTIVEISWILPLPFCSRFNPGDKEVVHEVCTVSGLHTLT